MSKLTYMQELRDRVSKKASKISQMPPKSNSTYTMEAGTLYEANKQLVTQTAKPLTHAELAGKQAKLDDWFNWIIDTYAMLLCHERRDYTVFHLYSTQNEHPTTVAASELIGCLTGRGEVLSIEETEDKAWEIWLKIGEEVFCYYLFRYDEAVIEC